MKTGCQKISLWLVALLACAVFFACTNQAENDLAQKNAAEIQRLNEIIAKLTTEKKTVVKKVEYPEAVPKQVIALFDAFKTKEGQLDPKAIAGAFARLDEKQIIELFKGFPWATDQGRELAEYLEKNKVLRDFDPDKFEQLDLEKIDFGRYFDAPALMKCCGDPTFCLLCGPCIYYTKCCCLHCGCWPCCRLCLPCKYCLLCHGCCGCCCCGCDCDCESPCEPDCVCDCANTIEVELTAGGTATVTKLQFTGDGVTVTQVGDTAVIEIPGGNGSITLPIAWTDVNKTGSDLADLETRSHTDLTDIGTYTHDQIDSHINDTSTNPHDVTKGQVLTGDLIVNADIAATAAIAESKLDITTTGHTHANKAELDLFETGDRANVVANTTARHTHANKTALDEFASGDHDAIVANTDHREITDGNPHGVGATDISDFDTEVSNNTDVDANTAARHTHSGTVVEYDADGNIETSTKIIFDTGYEIESHSGAPISCQDSNGCQIIGNTGMGASCD